MNASYPYWIGFNLVKGIGAVRFKVLLDYFGDAQRAWEAPPEALREAGLSQKLIENLIQVRSQVSIERLLENIHKQGITVMTWEDEAYPRRLKEIEQPPPVLYLRGEICSQDEWAVAVVGTRRITAYGRQVTEDIATTLALNKVTVISGLALGVDSVAHQAALQAGGRTLAVLGSGVDRVYPPENRRLAEQVMEQGALLSDYPLGTPPDGVNFPARNRLISGLALAVVVVEAGVNSGALITAAFAADQGREVFAVPGNIVAPQSKGTNRLIQDGAQPLLDPREILKTLELTRVPEQAQARASLPSDAVEASLYDLLGNEPLHVDELHARTRLPIEKICAALAMMELKGMVRQMSTMNYISVREEQADYR